VKYFTVIFSVLILIFFSNNKLFGQEPPFEEQEEAPATVWDMNIGDTDVELYLAGFWKIGLIAGLSVESGPEGIIFPAAFPGLTDFRFYQEPDLTISLWLMNRFYLETSFLEGFDKNTYAMGYRGMEGEPIQSVRIGNSEIHIDEYKGINVPSPQYNTPGISASFQTDISTHDVLLRYDPTSEQKKIFLGEFEITEEEINPGDYIRGQYFILPDGELDFLEIYIADKNGIYSGNDNKKYRRATDNEAFYSLTDGTVTLSEPSEVDVLVFYTVNGSNVGDTPVSDFFPPLINGEPDPAGDQVNFTDFSWSTADAWYPSLGTYETSSSVSVNGRTALKVYNPGKFGPFEYFNRYTVGSQLPQDLWRTEIYLTDNSLVKAGDSDSYEYNLNIDDKIISVGNLSNSDTRSAWSRYPLADSYPALYGSAETDNGLVGRTLLVSIKNTSGFNLGSGVVPGSEQIYINGYKTSSASVDYNSGQITFSKFIFPHDRIVVLYRTETIDLSGGDLLFAQGNRFFPSDYLELHLAEMFRWNISKKSSTTVDMTSQGGLTIAGGLKYERDNVLIELTSTMNLLTPDTTGYLRLLGMEESGYSFSIGKLLLKQSPDSIWDGSSTLLPANRSKLTFTDYYSTDGLGQYFLNSYNWTGAVTDPDLEGPSVAAGISEDTFTSNVMVMDYDLDIGEWAAGDLLLSPDGPIDLSRFTALTIGFKKQNSVNDIEAYILIGENGEYEDWDENGFVDSIDSSLIVSLDVSSELPLSDDTWSYFKHYFTPAQMDKLTKSRSIRILLRDKGTEASGKLLVGGVQLDGTIFDSTLLDSSDSEINNETNPTELLDISEIEGTIADELISDYSEVGEIFHPSGEKQKVLRINWDYSGPGDHWIAETNTSPVPADMYREFSFYIKNDTSSLTGSFDISLTDSRDRGYSFSYSPATTVWEKLTMSLETGIVTDSSGSQIAAASIDGSAGELTRFSIKGTGTTSGTIYIDELHFSDPTFSMDGNVELISDYSYPGTIAQTDGGLPLLADFSISNQFRYSGGTVLSSVSDDSHALQNNTSLSITMMLLAINANMKINWNQSLTEISGNHRLLFPADFPYGYLSDSYSRDGESETIAVNRSNSLKFILPDSGHITLSVTADGSGETLLQQWKGETGWEIASLFNISGILNFEQYSSWDNRDEGNYFSNWINDYNLISPAAESVKIRSVKSNADMALKTEPIGFTLAPHLSFETEDSPNRQQTNRGGFTFTLPVKLVDKSGSEWFLTPSYSRTFMEKRSSDSTGSFSDGFNNLGNDLGTWIPVTSFIPFYELFSDLTTEKFKDRTSEFNEASYKPEFGFNITRKFGSEIYDLFLPYSFDVNFIRSFGKKDDTFFNENTFEFAVKQTAVNLFGEFGVHRKFDFYNTDEFTSSIQFTMNVKDNNIPEPAELIYQNYFSFFGTNNSVVILENRFGSDFENTLISDTLDFKFIWRKPMRERFSLQFLNNLIEKEHFWSHEENLQLQFQYPWAENDDTDYTSLLITAKHESKLNVPGLGALKGWLTLGFFGNEELFRTGFEIGLEMEISF